MAPNQSEIPWVDAWIRWERNSKQCSESNKDNTSSESDEESLLPPPTEFHDFSYTTKHGSITVQIEGYHEDSEQIWNSTGLTLWRSSYYLCQFLVDHCDELFLVSSSDTAVSTDSTGSSCNTDVSCSRNEIHNRKQMKILEVGSGLGRCGILAHLLSKSNHGNTSTILTDGDTDTLKQLRRNVQNNIQDDAAIDCQQLLWGKEHAIQFLREQEGHKYDLIVGSDLLYVTSVIRPLFETVRNLLKPNGGKFLMAHCCRRVGNEVALDQVLNVARELGLDCTEELKNEEDIVLYSFRLIE